MLLKSAIEPTLGIGMVKCRRAGFTLIEMIGVLAVIAILASLLIPKIFEAINNAHISQTVLSCQTIKTAVLEHFAKYLSLASANGTNLNISSGVYTNYDGVLLTEALIDKPFQPQIGTGATIQLVDVTRASVNKPSKGAYDLDADGKSDVLGATYVVEAVIYGVPQADARLLNDLLDGPSLGEGATNGNDDRDGAGRVIYANPQGNGTLYEVHIYLTHH